MLEPLPVKETFIPPLLSSPYPNLDVPHFITIVEHEFRELTEASTLAAKLSSYTPNRSMTSVGLSEIFLNAIEHGNLGLAYSTKTLFASEKKWFEEINKRILDPENQDKYVRVTTEETPHYIKFTVIDKGAGFDFEQYENVKTVPLNNRNGRGILISKEAVFDKLIYFYPGNKVECIIYK